MRESVAFGARCRRIAVAALLSATAAVPLATAARANDSTAQLGAGGLQLIRNDVIQLLEEDLFVSAEEVRVTYRFRNRTDKPATFLVAFPLPAIDATVPEAINLVLPNGASPNFVDFRIRVDGEAVTPQIAERALALGIDRSAELRALGLPLNPYTEGIVQQLERLPPGVLADLNRVGLVLVEDWGMQAAWRLETAFYWEQLFPPGREIVVEHRYRPVVGYGFFSADSLDFPGYADTYCIDDSFSRAVRRRVEARRDAPNPLLDERRIAYILTTANNWSGPIGSFRLVVDKGDADALVSFCGDGVRKITETRFEMKATNFVPERDLDILILRAPRE